MILILKGHSLFCLSTIEIYNIKIVIIPVSEMKSLHRTALEYFLFLLSHSSKQQKAILVSLNWQGEFIINIQGCLIEASSGKELGLRKELKLGIRKLFSSL